MIAAIALMFLADAPTTCAPAGSHALRAGARLLPAIATVEPKPFEPDFTTSASFDGSPAEGEETGEATEPQPDQAPVQCEEVAIPIV